MSEVDAGYGPDDEYQPGIPVPGIRFVAQIGGAWRRAFGGWRPDARTVGVLVVAIHAGLLLDRLILVDLTWRYFMSSFQPAPVFQSDAWQMAVGATMQMLSVPFEALAVAAGLALALRRGWGRPLAIGVLASLFTIQVIDVVTYLSRGPMVRTGIAQVCIALGSGLPLAVLAWSRPAPTDG